MEKTLQSVRIKHMREQATSVFELTKGFTEPTNNNAMKAALEMSGYVLELTNYYEDNTQDQMLSAVNKFLELNPKLGLVNVEAFHNFQNEIDNLTTELVNVKAVLKETEIQLNEYVNDYVDAEEQMKKLQEENLKLKNALLEYLLKEEMIFNTLKNNKISEQPLIKEITFENDLKESDERIKKIMNNYRISGNDLSSTIEECDAYIEQDTKWRNESIERKDYIYGLSTAEFLIGKRMKIKQELINRKK